MNKKQWAIFCNFKDDFKTQVENWKAAAPELSALQKAAVEKAKAPLYPFETTVVYNRALDELTAADNIKLIVIGDNPGKDEQLTKNNKYLVGQAGKIAEGYFKKNPELGIDFRKNVIILNKTPIHSGKTNQLKTIAKLGGEKIVNLIKESQLWMAERTARLHRDLVEAAGGQVDAEGLEGGLVGSQVDHKGLEGGLVGSQVDVAPELWLVGYSELKNKGIFTEYRDRLKETYGKDSAWEKVYVFQHFSMNRFTIDLNDFIRRENRSGCALKENIHKVGEIHRDEIFLQS